MAQVSEGPQPGSPLKDRGTIPRVSPLVLLDAERTSRRINRLAKRVSPEQLLEFKVRTKLGGTVSLRSIVTLKTETVPR